jgi:hypothetical protein
VVTTLPLLAAIVALAVAACGPSVGTPAASGTSLPTLGPPWSGPPGPTPSPTSSSAVLIDPALLEILPAEVDGLPIAENAQGEQAALGDPLLAVVASAMAAGFAYDPATNEFVYAVVVRLLPGAMDGAVFRDWRDSYDEGACSQADGVLAHAETEMGGRTVYIGTCTGGLRTYHVWLEDRGVLVSASAAGERRLGELLVENLRP